MDVTSPFYESSETPLYVNRQQSLLKIFDSLDIFYNDLNRLIIEYDTVNQWEQTAFLSLKQTGHTNGILNYQQHLYLCTYDSKLLHLTTDGKIIKETSSFTKPCGIAMDENKLLSIADNSIVTILNLNFDILSSWKLPANSLYSFRGLKIDKKILYLTMYGFHQIFLCNKADGEILQKWGTPKGGSKQEEFNQPRGLTVNKEYIYICDYSNHRIQILKKENGKFFKQWGSGTNNCEFTGPISIYNDVVEEIFYIGDWCSVQLFMGDRCMQRLGGTKGNKMNEFDWVSGMCRCEDGLYVSDSDNQRIQIFKRSTNKM